MEFNSLEYHWKKYDDNMGLYKYYFDLSIRIIVWYSGVVGAIFAFFILHRAEQYITFILLIPFFLSLLLVCLSSSAINMLKIIEEELKVSSKKLNMDSYPTIVPLIWIMGGCALVFTLIMIGLSILFISNLSFTT